MHKNIQKQGKYTDIQKGYTKAMNEYMHKNDE